MSTLKEEAKSNSNSNSEALYKTLVDSVEILLSEKFHESKEEEVSKVRAQLTIIFSNFFKFSKEVSDDYFLLNMPFITNLSASVCRKFKQEALQPRLLSAVNILLNSCTLRCTPINSKLDSCSVQFTPKNSKLVQEILEEPKLPAVLSDSEYSEANKELKKLIETIRMSSGSRPFSEILKLIYYHVVLLSKNPKYYDETLQQLKQLEKNCAIHQIVHYVVSVTVDSFIEKCKIRVELSNLLRASSASSASKAAPSSSTQMSQKTVSATAVLSKASSEKEEENKRKKNKPQDNKSVKKEEQPKAKNPKTDLSPYSATLAKDIRQSTQLKNPKEDKRAAYPDKKEKHLKTKTHLKTNSSQSSAALDKDVTQSINSKNPNRQVVSSLTPQADQKKKEESQTATNRASYIQKSSSKVEEERAIIEQYGLKKPQSKSELSSSHKEKLRPSGQALGSSVLSAPPPAAIASFRRPSRRYSLFTSTQKPAPAIQTSRSYSENKALSTNSSTTPALTYQPLPSRSRQKFSSSKSTNQLVWRPVTNSNTTPALTHQPSGPRSSSKAPTLGSYSSSNTKQITDYPAELLFGKLPQQSGWVLQSLVQSASSATFPLISFSSNMPVVPLVSSPSIPRTMSTKNSLQAELGDRIYSFSISNCKNRELLERIQREKSLEFINLTNTDDMDMVGLFKVMLVAKAQQQSITATKKIQIDCQNLSELGLAFLGDALEGIKVFKLELLGVTESHLTALAKNLSKKRRGSNLRLYELDFTNSKFSLNEATCNAIIQLYKKNKYLINISIDGQPPDMNWVEYPQKSKELAKIRKENQDRLLGKTKTSRATDIPPQLPALLSKIEYKTRSTTSEVASPASFWHSGMSTAMPPEQKEQQKPLEHDKENIITSISLTGSSTQ